MESVLVMRNIIIAAALIAASSAMSASTATAEQRCFQSQKSRCHTVNGREYCQYFSVRQCFQVPGIRNDRIKKSLRPNFRRHR
jgi:uncharacterized membrane protein